MISMQHRKNKRGLQQLSDVQKMEAITKVQKGETKAAVAREFGVPESTLRGWCKKAKLNGHCQSVMNKSLQVTSTMSPVLMTAEMAYRDCGYSKGSGSDEGSTIHPFSDEPEDEDIKPTVVIPEEQRRVLDWLNYGHYSQLAAQTPSTNDNKPAQPVVTSSTCDDIVKPTSKSSKPCKPNNDHCNRAQMLPVFSKSVSFYNWCKTNTSTVCDGYSSPVSPISPASSDKIDSYEDEPLALVVPSKRRLSDLETCFKNEINKIYHDRPVIINNTIHNNINNNDNNTVNNNNNNDNNNCFSKNNNFIVTPYNVENGLCNGDKANNYNYHHRVAINQNLSDNGIISKSNYCNDGIFTNDKDDSTKQTLTVEEALKHGEVFLDWLKACSDPNVTVFQAMQIGTLLKNLRSSLERSQNRR